MGRFRAVHKGDGSKAPNCEIHVDFFCGPSHCSAGSIKAEVVEKRTKVVLAKGTVRCEGEWTPHTYRMLVKRQRQATRVKIRYTCGGQTKEVKKGVIWIRCR